MTKKDVVEFKIRREGKTRQIILNVVLSIRTLQAGRLQRVINVALAVAILGLVVLLAFQITPTLGIALLRLLSLP